MSLDQLAQVANWLIMAGAIYGGIRADLRALHERAARAEQAAEAAHRRIDQHLEKGH